MPPKGAKYELNSLVFQSNRVSDINVELDENKSKELKNWYMERFPSVVLPNFIRERRAPTINEIKSHFVYLNRVSGPGLPFAEFYSSKGDFIDEDPDGLATIVQNRFILLTKVTLSNETPVSLLLGDYMDPVRLFIKDEPHPVKKLLEGRYRLISSLSIIDELIQSLLFRSQILTDVLYWPNIPSKAGMGLATEEQERDVFNYVSPWISKAVSTDVSGWDWSVREWLFTLGKNMILDLSDSNDYYKLIVNNVFYCINRSVYATSNGNLYTTSFTGTMLSGMPTTAFLNSRMRAIVAKISGSDEMCTMGDDCVESSNDPLNIVDNYAKMGFRITDVKLPNGNDFSFCSHKITKNFSVPENPAKSLYNLVSKLPVQKEHLESFKLEQRNNPQLLGYLQLVEVIETNLSALVEERAKDSNEKTKQSTVQEEEI